LAVVTSGRKTNHKIDRNTFELYDESVGYDDEVGVKFAPDLSALDKRRAVLLYRLFTPPREVSGLWGLCVVYGKPGSGKDLFGNYLSHTIKRYFPWKRILRDEPPKGLFGPYGGLFNEEVLQDDFSRMRMATKGLKLKESGLALEKEADVWVQGAGEIMLKNSLLYLSDTLWNRCNKREPHNPMNKTMGAIFKVYRHLDCFTLATIQTTDDLDRFTVKPYINWMVTCTKSSHNVTGFVFYIQRVTYDKRMDVLMPIGRPFPLPVDAGKPRSFLGDGKIRFTERAKYYQPETEEERVVLEVLKSGVDTYDGVVELLETDGDMAEDETLDTLKSLGLKLPYRKPKLIIDYPCYFKIFQSKSAPQYTTKVKVGD